MWVLGAKLVSPLWEKQVLLVIELFLHPHFFYIFINYVNLYDLKYDPVFCLPNH